MPRPTPHLVIDARPRGPRGPLAGERVLGRRVLAHLLDLAVSLRRGDPIVVHARLEEHGGSATGRGPAAGTGRLRDRARRSEARRSFADRPALRPAPAPPRGPARARPGIGGDLEARPPQAARRRRGRADPAADVPAARPILGARPRAAAGPAASARRGSGPTR